MASLEPICAEYGHKMIISGNDPKLTDQENVITRALGVMAENGLYAMCVFLLSCNKKEYGKIVLTQHIWELWTKTMGSWFKLGLRPFFAGDELGTGLGRLFIWAEIPPKRSVSLGVATPRMASSKTLTG